MELLSFNELDTERDRFDALVASTPDIDSFCSSTMWLLPAHEAFGPRHDSVVHRTAAGYIALVRAVGADEHGNAMRVVQPLELSWGFPSPLIGPSPEPLAEDLAHLLLRFHDWDLVALSGIVPESPTFDAILERLGRNFRLFRGESTRRYRSSLEGGLDAFLAKRSRDFRKNARRGFTKAANTGLTFVQAPMSASADQANALYDRLLAVDDSSWKGLAGVGLNASAMTVHYRGITKRLAERGLLRLWFCQHDGRDVAYILGGLFAKTYRGLQFAYDAAYTEYGLGNLAQLTTIETLGQEG
ncbi:MAG: GNAT family N-acetyltransferase, partial [Clostridia bacterium]|nr:GNAT family N-acetyltransferase [Deltaproteobacteria bacterium]